MSGPLENARHERFAQELAKGGSQTDAYIAAGYKGDRTAASRLSTNVNIQNRVAEILAAAGERVEITKARVLEELGKIGFSDIRRLFSSGGSLIPMHELDDEAAACLSAIEVVTKKAPGGEEAEVEHVSKIRLWDKRAALVDIGKHLGMFTEKHEHTGKDGGPIEVADMSDAEATRRMLFLIARARQQRPETIN